MMYTRLSETFCDYGLDKCLTFDLCLYLDKLMYIKASPSLMLSACNRLSLENWIRLPGGKEHV